MIIQCESCATRFKISDDKVGDTGVKVRCSKCNHVFTAKKEAAVASQVPQPAFDGGFGATSNQSNIFRPPPQTGAAIPPARPVTGIFRAPVVPGAPAASSAAAAAPRPPSGLWPAMQPPPGAPGPSLPSASEFGRPDTFIGDPAGPSAITIIPASALKPPSAGAGVGMSGAAAVYDPFSPPPAPPPSAVGGAASFDPFGAMPTVPAVPRPSHRPEAPDPFANNGDLGSGGIADPFTAQTRTVQNPFPAGGMGIADPFTSSGRPPSPPPSPPMAPDPFGAGAGDALDPFSNPLPTSSGSIPDSFQAQATAVATIPPQGFGALGDDPFDQPTRAVAAPDLKGHAPAAPSVDPWQVPATPPPAQPQGRVPFPSPPMGTAAPMATVSQASMAAGDDPFAGMALASPADGGLDDGGSLFPSSQPKSPTHAAPAKGRGGAAKPARDEDPFAALGMELGTSGGGEQMGDVPTRIHQITPELAAEARRVRDEMAEPRAAAPVAKAAPSKALPPPKGASSEPDGPRSIPRVAWSVAWQAAVLGAFLTVSLVVARGGSVDDLLAGRAVAVLAGDAPAADPDAVKAPVRVEDVVVARRPVRGDSGLVVVSGVVVNEGSEAIPAAKVVVGFGDATRSFTGIAGAVVDGADLARAADRASLDALASAWPTAPAIAAGARVPFVVLATDVRDGSRAEISVQTAAPPAPPVVVPEPPPPVPTKSTGKPGAKTRAAPVAPTAAAPVAPSPVAPSPVAATPAVVAPTPVPAATPPTP